MHLKCDLQPRHRSRSRSPRQHATSPRPTSHASHQGAAHSPAPPTLTPSRARLTTCREHDKTPIVRNGVPGRARADSGRYSLLRHAQGRRVGWLWAAVGGSGDAARLHGRAGARQAAESGQKWAHRRVPGSRGRGSRATAACRRVLRRSIDLSINQTPRAKDRGVEELPPEYFSAPSSASRCLAALIRR